MTTGPRTIETRSLSEQVYHYLCAKIIDGEINYGEIVNIKLLAEELGVSSMPVREAVKRLQNEGLVTIKPRSTCLIKKPTKRSILSVIEMRELLQVFFVGKIVSAEKAPDLAVLAGIVDAMKGAAEDSEKGADLRRFIDLDREFHMEICRLGGNEFAEKSFREVSLHLNTKFMYDISVPPDLPLTFRDHLQILEAIKARSPDAAEHMRQHLRRSHENIRLGELFKTLK
jgi:DNA-binding GntR family transcriptional regulator